MKTKVKVVLRNSENEKYLKGYWTLSLVDTWEEASNYRFIWWIYYIVAIIQFESEFIKKVFLPSFLHIDAGKSGMF